MVYSPCILIVQFSLSPSESSHSIVYPLILDCTVNDMFDIILGLIEDKSVEKSGALLIGVNEKTGSSASEYVSDPICSIVSSSILHLSIIESVTIHWYCTGVVKQSIWLHWRMIAELTSMNYKQRTTLIGQKNYADRNTIRSITLDKWKHWKTITCIIDNVIFKFILPLIMFLQFKSEDIRHTITYIHTSIVWFDI